MWRTDAKQPRGGRLTGPGSTRRYTRSASRAKPRGPRVAIAVSARPIKLMTAASRPKPTRTSPNASKPLNRRWSHSPVPLLLGLQSCATANTRGRPAATGIGTSVPSRDAATRTSARIAAGATPRSNAHHGILTRPL